MNTTEQKIIALLKEGDRKAISLLYDHYADTLFGVIRNIVKDEAHARDALQDSFIKYWQKGKNYDPQKAKLFTWLLKIARNTAIDKYRSINNRGSKEIQTSDFNVNNNGYNQIRPQFIDMQDQVQKLEWKYQEVIQALFFKGMTHKEASESLNLPLGTIKTRLRNGLRQLRKIFGEHELAIMILIFILS